MQITTQQREALGTIRRLGYLLRLENSDAWFIAHHRPPQDLPEALMEAEEIAYEDADALIDAGLVTKRLQYSLDGGTLVLVCTPAKQPRRHAQASRSEQPELLP